MLFTRYGSFKKLSLLLLFALFFADAQAQDTLKNLPEYSLPITGQKLVIAHCMTNIIRYKGHPYEDSGNPDYYAPTGNITATLGADAERASETDG